MTNAASPVRVPWIDPMAGHPLCDVPWIGTSIVQANGNVNFCCYSDAVAGNVNESTFPEIWNGAMMHRIRQELSAGRLPDECHSGSCPIFRRDALHHILDRIEGRHSQRRTGTHDPHRRLREALQESRLVVSRDTAMIGERVGLVLTISSVAAPLAADLFVALRSPDGQLCFLPSLEGYAVPCRTELPLGVTTTIELWDGPLAGGAGAYLVCAALFEQDSNPNILSNCYWAANATITLKQPTTLQSAWRRLRASLQ